MTRPATGSYLMPHQVAELLDVSPKTVTIWANKGKLPSLKTLGGHRRYPEAEIRALVERLKSDATENGRR
jgi:excisionase family DNA binding protein